MDDGNLNYGHDWQDNIEALRLVNEYASVPVNDMNHAEAYGNAPVDAGTLDYTHGQFNHVNIHPASELRMQLQYEQSSTFLNGGADGFSRPAIVPMPMGTQMPLEMQFAPAHSYAFRPQPSANMFDNGAQQAQAQPQSQSQSQSSASGQSTEPSPLVAPVVAPEPPANSERRSSTRALCPNQALRASTGRVTKLSAAQNNHGPSPLGGGPTSKRHEIPARPKPGRKPAQDVPDNKRKAQNRTSQRNFRARKVKTVQDLQDQLAAAEQERKEENNQSAFQIAQLRQENRRLQDEIDELKTAYAQQAYGGRPLHFNPNQLRDARHDSPLHRDFGSPDNSISDPELDCKRCTPDHCACLAEMTNGLAFHGDASAPMDGVSMTGVLRGGHAASDVPSDFEELETDFTTKFASSASRAPAFTSPNDETKAMDCGFCDGNPEICVCADTSLGPDGKDEMTEISRIKSSSSSDDIKPNLAMTGPGSCADCQSDPAQRAWCQRVAQLRSEATPPSSRRNSSRGSSLDTMEPKALTRVELNEISSSPIGAPRTVGCSDAFKLLHGRVSTDPNAMDWRNLRPVTQSFAQQDARKDTFTMEPGRYSAMELDASSILTTLQHARGPLQPRASDGSHARLVEQAEERRRVSSDDHDMLDAVSQYNIRG